MEVFDPKAVLEKVREVLTRQPEADEVQARSTVILVDLFNSVPADKIKTTANGGRAVSLADLFSGTKSQNN